MRGPLEPITQRDAILPPAEVSPLRLPHPLTEARHPRIGAINFSAALASSSGGRNAPVSLVIYL